MKKIYLIRHGNTSFGLNDRSRTLDNQGKRESYLVGKFIKDSKISPDIVFSSTSIRTRQTIGIIAGEAKIDTKDIVYNDRYYTFSAGRIIELISGFDESYGTIFVIGHNPAMMETVAYLTGIKQAGYPTCGLSVLSARGKWRDIMGKSCSLDLFIAPDELAHIYED